jgi:hypothetical protein
MFLLNNTHERVYAKIYPSIRHVAFDISESQLNNVRNRDWVDIVEGSIVCVVNSTRKISTFRRIDGKRSTGVVDESGNLLHVITGPVIGKLPQDVDMTTLLKNYGISHPSLPRNVFSIGFNVANLRVALDALALTTKNGMKTLAELKRGA